MRIVVTGGTGFIGRHLVRSLLERGDEVAVLTRDASRRPAGLDPRARLAPWGAGAEGWPAVLDGADVIVNLAGETIAQRWTGKAKERILGSRVHALDLLGEGLRAVARPPKALVSASAVGFYGPHGEEPLTEDSPAGADFLASTCVAWEAAAKRLGGPALRVAVVRIGLVLATDGGALPKMLPPFRIGLGAPIGSGRQMMSFIHVEDLVALLLRAVDDDRAQGPINGTAPEPVSMNEFARALRRALRRPSLVPGFLARAGSSMALPAVMGEMATLVLEGQRVLPARAQALGFAWRFPRVDAALQDLLT